MMGIDVPVPLLVLLITFGILGLGVLVVLYGTIAKNRWGINLEAVSCPRCNTPAPVPREPQSLRQARWGDWTCPVCGAEVDKWGREIASAGPRRSVKAGGLTRAALKKRSIITAAAGYFCLTLLFDWIGVTGHRWVPSTLYEALIQVGAAIAETAVFTALFYFATSYVGKRLFPVGKGSEPAHGHKPDRNRQA